MLYYAKVINENTKECMVINQIEAQELGWEQLEVEIGYNGKFYLAGFAPEKPVADLKREVRAVRDRYLQDTDYTQLPDAPFDEEEQQSYADYRQYLRDYTKSEDWWLENPKTYHEWKRGENE